MSDIPRVLGYAKVRLDEVSARSTGALDLGRKTMRNAMGELLQTFPWSIYCTWQFRGRIGEDGALGEVVRWLGLLRFAYGQAVGYMVGLEQDLGDEWPHVHGLVCGTRRLRESITLYEGKVHQKRVPLLEPFWLAWKERHGGGRFEVVEGGSVGCSFYCAKYAAKRGQVVFSSNLERFRGTDSVLAPFTLFPAEGMA